jgi:hypothetical protein
VHDDDQDHADWPACPGHHDDDRPGAPVWCAECTERIRQSLRGLPAAYRALANTQTVATRERPERVGPAGPGSVPREIAHADEILRTVCGWEDELRRHLGQVRRWLPTGHVHEGRDLVVAVEYLLARHAAAVCAPFAVEYGQEVFALRAEAVVLVGGGDTAVRPSRVRIEGVLCPLCGRQGLYRRNGAEGVACAHCDAAGSEAEYGAHTRLQAQEYAAAGSARVRVRPAPIIDGYERAMREEESWTMKVHMPVQVLLVVGEWAELTTPDRNHRDPERVNAAYLSRETGIPVEQLPGKRLTALVDEDGNLAGFTA